MKGTAKNRWVHGFVIGTFVALYFMVSIISTIHVIDFFKLSNPTWLAISLAVAFEIGAAASLAAIVILEKTSGFMVWSLFLILTLMQAMGNTYYAFVNLADFQGWIELFGLVDAELIQQKRILSIVSGAILPIVALGFIKSLVDYIRPEDPNKMPYVEENDELGFLGEEPKKKQHRTAQESLAQEEESNKKIRKEVLEKFHEPVSPIEEPVPPIGLREQEAITKLFTEPDIIEDEDPIFNTETVDEEVDDIEEMHEGKQIARGLDTFIEILEEESKSEELLQKIPTTHLPQNTERHNLFGEKPISLDSNRLEFIKNNIMLIGSIGQNIKNEKFVPKSEIAKLGLTKEEFTYLNAVAGHPKTKGITDEDIDIALNVHRLTGISKDVGMEERITQKNKDEFKGNI